MTEAEMRKLEPGQHVWRRRDHHELQILEVEPDGYVFAWDLDAKRAAHVNGWLLEAVPS